MREDANPMDGRDTEANKHVFMRELGHRLILRIRAMLSPSSILRAAAWGGGFPVNRSADAPLTPVLEQVVDELRRIAPERAIEARFAIDEPVFCDRGRIGQLASNLVANAITHGASDQPIRFEALTRGDVFELSVSNAGSRIPEDVRSQLFQPFFRGAARASRNGLGLGLYIAYEVANAHDGAIDATSTNEETRFTFTMPKADPSGAQR